MTTVLPGIRTDVDDLVRSAHEAHAAELKSLAEPYQPHAILGHS